MNSGRIIALTALIASVTALALGEFRHARDKSDILGTQLALRAEIDAITAQTSAALSAVIRPEIVETANKSVYLITDNEDPVAAAFVIDRDKGLLATAAHTAQSLRLGLPEATIEIINQYSAAPMPVRSRRIHAGFGAFVSVVENYQPVRKTSKLAKPKVVSIEDLPFDVALITVDPIDPNTGHNRLGPNLPLASDKTLLALKAGDPIAVIGFPDDRVARDLTGSDAASRVERGVVAAMIAPLDSATTARNPVINNLIVHRMATAGGNSGGPIINTLGEVIGVHSHGVKSQSSNADGVAQRADMIRDLLTDGDDERRLFSVFIPAWRNRLREWERAQDILPWAYYAEHSGNNDLASIFVKDIAEINHRPFDVTTRQVLLTKQASSYQIAAPDAKKDAGFTVPDAGQFFEARFEVDPQRDAVIFAFDYDLNNRQGYCPLDAYWREEGDARMQVQRSTNATKIVLRRQSKTRNKRIVHAVFRRGSKCGYKSDKILVGQLSWNNATINTAAPTDETPHPINAAFAGLGNIRTNVANFIECRTSTGGVFAECNKGDFLDLSAPDAAQFSVDNNINGTGLFEAESQ